MQDSAVDSLIADTLKHAQSSQTDYTALASQILHNLRHQHDWTDLTLHTKSATTPSSSMPRPIVSGMPPRRLYTHPDEQAEFIAAGVPDEAVPAEREWVLPSHLHEDWSLARLGDAFDAVSSVPPRHDGDVAPDPGRWRQTKRLLLATVDDDSTVVYYVVHDGIVKPRQN